MKGGGAVSALHAKHEITPFFNSKTKQKSFRGGKQNYQEELDVPTFRGYDYRNVLLISKAKSLL